MIIKFLFKSLYFLSIVFFSITAIFLLENGTADPFYQRLISGQKKSLIIGTSKSAQGIVPSILNEELGLVKENEIFNFSFTIVHSPFGKVYYNRIFQKLRPDTKDGVFIVTIDPWSISADCKDPENESDFIENKLFISKIGNVNARIINWEYILLHYINPYYEILLRYFMNNSMKVHPDGWLEVNLKQGENGYENRVKSKEKEYIERVKRQCFSCLRFQEFEKLITELQNRGTVYLIRLPVDSKLLDFDKRVVPDFNSKLDYIIEKNNLPYLDFTKDVKLYKYTDGEHVHKNSSVMITNQIANWIREINK